MVEVKPIVEIGRTHPNDHGKLQWTKIYYKMSNGILMYTSDKQGKHTILICVEHKIGHYDGMLRGMNPQLLIGPENE